MRGRDDPVPADRESTTAQSSGPPTTRAPRSSSSLLGGASMLAVGRYANSLLGFVGTVIIVRVLSQHDYGEYAFVISLLSIVGLVAEMRLSRAVLVAVFDAGDDADRVVGSYVGLRLAIGVISYAVFVLVVIAAGYPASILKAAAVVGCTLVIASAGRAMMILCEARLWMRTMAASLFAGAAAQLVVTVVLSATGQETVVAFMWALVANFTVTLAYLVVAFRGSARVRPSFHWPEWKEWLLEALPLSIGQVLDTVYFRVDMVMLSIIGSFTATGLYSVGYKFTDILGGAIPVAILTPALTLLVRSWPGDRERFHSTFRHALVLLTVCGVVAVSGFVLFAGDVIRTAYGADYRKATDATIWLVLGMVLHFYTALCVTTLMAVKRNVLYPIAMVVGLVINVVLNVIVIPRYSYTGAAVNTVITEVIVLTVLVAGALKVEGTRPLPWAPLAKCLGAGAAMFGLSWLLEQVVPWPVALVFSVLVYAAVLHLLQVDGPGGLRVLLDRELVHDVTPVEMAAGIPDGAIE